MHPNSLANLKPPIQPGVSGNPGGKPVGARNAINAKFLNALLEVFDAKGKAAIEAVAETDPATFVRALVALQPKQVEFRDPFDDLTDEQLDAAYGAVRAILAAQSARGQAIAQSERQETPAVPALPETG